MNKDITSNEYERPAWLLVAPPKPLENPRLGCRPSTIAAGVVHRGGLKLDINQVRTRLARVAPTSQN